MFWQENTQLTFRDPFLFNWNKRREANLNNNNYNKSKKLSTDILWLSMKPDDIKQKYAFIITHVTHS